MLGIILTFASGAVLVAFLYIGAIYNNFIKKRNYVKEAFSTMDVYLKKRWDLIPNLVETTKGYVQYEQGLFEKITQLRNQNYSSFTKEEKLEVNREITSALSRLIAVAENYPDLKASQNFSQLMSELSKAEEDIANARKYYNGTTREYNTCIELFPNNIFAGIFNFKQEELFEIAENERENIKVSF